MCAIEAGKRGRRVLVIEHADRIGKKILISGGGRCNFTNLHAGADNFISRNPHFAKSALARYGPDAFLKLVEKHRIPYHEKKLGQLFCDRSANDIVTMLEEECRAAQVEIRLNTKITEVAKTGAIRPARRRCNLHRAPASCCDGRAVNSENRRNLLWLRSGPAIWPQDSADRAPLWYHLCSAKGIAEGGAILPASQRKSSRPRPARSNAFAKKCSSRIAALVGRQFFKYPLTGMVRNPF